MATRALTLAQLEQLKQAGHNYVMLPGGQAVGIDELIKNPDQRQKIDASSIAYGGTGQGVSINDFFGPDTAAAASPATSAAAAQGAPAGSYLGLTGSAGPQISAGVGGTAGAGGIGDPTATAAGGGGNMTWTQAGTTLGLSQSDINAFNQAGFTPDQVVNSYQTTGKPPTAPPPQPEQIALQQMGQIDPASEVLRQGLAKSYLTPLAQSAQPTAPQFQSLLQTYGAVDPTAAAARTKLGQDLSAQEALGTKLDAGTIRELEQATRQGQAARGNIYGTPQLVQEAMTRGQAGLALQQQRQQALQGYLTSGASTGDLAMNLYNQQQNQLRATQGAALGYLGSGQTPYQAGAGYLNAAEQRATTAAQGGAAYQPQGPSGYYTGGGTSTFPTYGLDMSTNAGNWYNNINQANLQAYGLQQAYGQGGQNKGGKAAAGAIGGAASGALAGAAAGGVGAIPGAIIGGIAGGAGGYFS